MREPQTDCGGPIDSDLLEALDLIPPLADLSTETLTEKRALLSEATLIGSTPTVLCETVALPSDRGGPVPALLYRPVGDGPFPALLNIHGGGFVMGSAAREDRTAHGLATDLGAVVLTVDYRLAPETPFPGALEDCQVALAWLQAEAARLKVDPQRIAVRGVSAGGALAAGLALRNRDQGGPSIRSLILLYPMLDDRTREDRFAGQHVWTAQANDFGWRSYLGVSAGGDNVSIYAAPARAEDFSGLPPTFLAVGSIDLFVDEDIAFARRLIRCGVPTELHVYPGAYHGFNLIESAGVARALQLDSQRALTRAFTPSVLGSSTR